MPCGRCVLLAHCAHHTHLGTSPPHSTVDVRIDDDNALATVIHVMMPRREHTSRHRTPARASIRSRCMQPTTHHCPEIVTMRTASRSLFVLAAALAFPVFASAQSASPMTKPAAPVAKPAAAATAKPATAPAVAAPTAAKVAAPVMPTSRPATAAATPATAAPAAAAPAEKKAGPARDANGRFIAKSAAPAAAAVSATCKDGSTWTGKVRSGACARHGGVKSFN